MRHVIIFEILAYSSLLRILNLDVNVDAYVKLLQKDIPAGIYLLKVNTRNTGRMCEIYSKVTFKTPERPHWRCYVAFILNFKHIPHLVLVFLLVTLNM